MTIIDQFKDIYDVFLVSPNLTSKKKFYSRITIGKMACHKTIKSLLDSFILVLATNNLSSTLRYFITVFLFYTAIPSCYYAPVRQFSANGFVFLDIYR